MIVYGLAIIVGTLLNLAALNRADCFGMGVLEERVLDTSIFPAARFILPVQRFYQQFCALINVWIIGLHLELTKIRVEVNTDILFLKRSNSEKNMFFNI